MQSDPHIQIFTREEAIDWMYKHQEILTDPSAPMICIGIEIEPFTRFMSIICLDLTRQTDPAGQTHWHLNEKRFGNDYMLPMNIEETVAVTFHKPIASTAAIHKNGRKIRDNIIYRIIPSIQIEGVIGRNLLLSIHDKDVLKNMDLSEALAPQEFLIKARYFLHSIRLQYHQRNRNTSPH